VIQTYDNTAQIESKFSVDIQECDMLMIRQVYMLAIEICRSCWKKTASFRL